MKVMKEVFILRLRLRGMLFVWLWLVRNEAQVKCKADFSLKFEVGLRISFVVLRLKLGFSLKLKGCSRFNIS